MYFKPHAATFKNIINPSYSYINFLFGCRAILKYLPYFLLQIEIIHHTCKWYVWKMMVLELTTNI